MNTRMMCGWFFIVFGIGLLGFLGVTQRAVLEWWLGGFAVLILGIVFVRQAVHSKSPVTDSPADPGE